MLKIGRSMKKRYFFFSSRRRHTRLQGDWSSDVCSSDLEIVRHLSNTVPWPYPADGAECFVREKAIPMMESGDAWFWSLRLKQAPERLIGLINLVKGDLINRGFWVGLKWQG